MYYKILALAAVMAAAFIPAFADDMTVFQENKAFSANEVTLKTGQSVTFTNKDPVTHNVFSGTAGMEFDLKTQKPGQSTTIVFDRPGDAEVQCAIHPQMSMTVHVQ